MSAPTQVVIRVDVSQDSQFAVQVQGPTDPFLLLGMIEVGKAHVFNSIVQPQKEKSSIIPPPAGLGEKFKSRFDEKS